MIAELWAARKGIGAALVLALLAGFAARSAYLDAQVKAYKEEKKDLTKALELARGEVELLHREAAHAAELMAELRARAAELEAEHVDRMQTIEADPEAQDWLDGPLPDTVRRVLSCTDGPGRPNAPACQPVESLR